jgi:hypothetical protein
LMMVKRRMDCEMMNARPVRQYTRCVAMPRAKPTAV